MNVLNIRSSANGAGSVSNRLADAFLAKLDGAQVTVRDVGAQPLPHLVPETVAAIRATPSTPAELEARALSDALIAELQAADLIVIGSPMYNFGMSSTLRTWFDHVLRAGVTFRYTEAGPEGLLKGKKVIVIQSRAGLYSEGPAAAMDSQEPHLRTLLGFMGLDEDVTFVSAEKLAFGPEAAEAAIADAAATLDRLAAQEPALAA